MSRVRLLGSRDIASGTPIGDATPRKCFFSQVGVRNAGATVGFGTAFAFDDDEICELWYRIVTWQLAYSVSTSTVDEDSTITAVGSFTGNITLAGDEDDRADRGLNDQPPFWSGTISGDYVVTEDENPPVTTSINFTPSLGVSITTGAFAGGTFDPYSYNPSTGLWIPTFEFFLNLPAALLVTQSSLEVVTGNEVTTQTGLYRGSAFDISTGTQQAGTIVTGFSLSITPVLWLAYNNIAMDTPIWSTTTGAELSDHSTTED